MKAIFFVGSSQRDIQEFPEEVKDDVGYALYQVQRGVTPACIKPLRGFGPGVLEIIEDSREGTYRAVYTVKFNEAVYVLHCFQKKSKHGIETPPGDIELIRQRLKLAEEYHRADHRP